MTSAETKQSNQSLIRDEVEQGVVDVRTFPYEIQFSPEHRCNLRCVQCYATVVRNDGGVPLMDVKLPPNTLERFQKLEPFADHWECISLTGSGEPLLSPAFPGILEILERHDCWVSFNTHGLLVDRKRARMLVENGVDEIRFSMDGATKETFEKIRVNAKWDAFVRAIDTLNEVKRELGSSKPMLVFSSNFMRQNIEELPALIDFAAERGAIRVMAHNTIIYDPKMEQQALVHYPNLVRRMFMEARERAERLGIELENHLCDVRFDGELPPPEADAPAPPPLEVNVVMGELPEVDLPDLEDEVGTAAKSCDAPAATSDVAPAFDGPAIVSTPVNSQVDVPENASDILKACQKPWTGLYVENDGNVKVCCFESPYVGNLDEQPFEEIWNGAPMQSLRRSFVEGKPPEGCANCFIFAQYQERENVFIRPKTVRWYIDEPAENGTLSGDKALIHGWALDKSGVESVEIMIDAQPVAQAIVGHERGDVVAVHTDYADQPDCGFHIHLDTTGLENGYHFLSLRITSKAGDVMDAQPRLVRIENP